MALSVPPVDFDFDPSPETLDASPQELIEIFSPSLAEDLAAAIATLGSATGTLALAGGLVTGEVTTPAGLETISLDGASFFESLVEQAGALTASATLAAGQFVGDLTVDGVTFATAIDAAALLDTALTTLLAQTEVTVPFANGAFALDIATEFGNFTGSLDFADGDLNLDLTTPFGVLDLDFAFPADYAIPFDFETPFGVQNGSVDLASGQVIIPLFGPFSAPISALSGAVSLSGGTATLAVDIPEALASFLGEDTLAASFEIGPLASQLVAEFSEVTGSLTASGGLVDLTLASELGSVDLDFSLVEIAQEALDFVTATAGSLGLTGDGLATVSLDTPLGGVETQIAVTEIADLFTSPISDLF